MAEDIPILEAVPAEEEEPSRPGVTQTPPNMVPVKIHMKNGKTFVVEDINSWVYEDNGVFASGHFKERTTDTDVLIPYENVDYYELDFPRLKKFIERAREEQASEDPGA